MEKQGPVAGEDAPRQSAARFDSAVASFKFPAYRTIWAGNFFFSLAYFMSAAAQAVVAYDIAGNNVAVGIVMSGQGFSLLFLFPVGGALADRFSKRRLVLTAQTVMGIMMLITAILLQADMMSVVLLSVFTFIIGSMLAVNAPTRTAMVGDTVTNEYLGNAVALMQISNNIGRITGPVIAGVLLSISFIGSSGAYFIIAALFAVVVLTLSNLPNGKPVEKQTSSVFADVGNAIGYVRRRGRLLHAVLSYYMLSVLGLANVVVFPGFAKDVLHSGNAGLGILLGASAAGGFVSTVVIASMADSRQAQLLLSVCGFIAGGALILSGLAPTMLIASITLFMVGFGNMSFQTLSTTLALRLSEPAFYGRMIGLIFMAAGWVNVLSLPLGVIADEVGERLVLSGSGALMCAAVVVMLLTQPVNRLDNATEMAKAT